MLREVSVMGLIALGGNGYVLPKGENDRNDS